MAVRSTQGQNKAVRSTKGGRGVSPSFNCLGKVLKDIAVAWRLHSALYSAPWGLCGVF